MKFDKEVAPVNLTKPKANSDFVRIKDNPKIAVQACTMRLKLTIPATRDEETYI